MGSKRKSGLNSGISGFQHGPGHRSYWGTFEHIFPENGDTGLESEITDFYGKKTGLFIPYWMADLSSDGLEQGKQGKACFWTSKWILLFRFVKTLIFTKL